MRHDRQGNVLRNHKKIHGFQQEAVLLTRQNVSDITHVAMGLGIQASMPGR